MNPEAQDIVARLGLAPLPLEGGFYAQTWVNASGSAIYFLLADDDFSAMHRLAGDEIWHHYAGDPVELVRIDPGSGATDAVILGAALEAGQMPQCVVRGGVWQGARRAGGARGWALMGCTMAPAWNAAAFELGPRERLTREFPAAANWISALTRV